MKKTKKIRVNLVQNCKHKQQYKKKKYIINKYNLPQLSLHFLYNCFTNSKKTQRFLLMFNLNLRFICVFFKYLFPSFKHPV